MKQSSGALYCVACVSLALITACTPMSPSYVTIPEGGALSNADSVRAVWGALHTGSAKQFMRLGLNCGGCKVPVEISPVADEETFDPARPPTVPRAVAHVVNRGSVPTEMYGFQPNADDYFVVAKDSIGRPVWSIVNIPYAAHGQIIVTKGKGVQGCHHTKADRAAAAFQTCDGAQHVVKNPSVVQLAARGLNWLTASVTRILAEDPAWVACSDGCCTLNAT